MPTVNHEVFLDLESALSTRLENAVTKQLTPILRQIETAVAAGDFLKAEELAYSLTTVPAIEKNTRFIETSATAGLFLGVSRLTSDIRTSATFADMPKTQVDVAVDQTQIMLARNATREIQKQALQLIAQTEAIADEQVFTTSEEEDSSFTPTAAGIAIAAGLATAVAGARTATQANKLASKAIRVMVNKDGRQFMALGSSLLISRISAFGFMNEATERGIAMYQINEVLDSNTCPVCEEMNGKRFPVSDGLLHMSALLSTDDPDLHRTLAPWPNQSKAGVEELRGMTRATLINNGLLTPPYHPGCRGIVVEA